MPDFKNYTPITHEEAERLITENPRLAGAHYETAGFITGINVGDWVSYEESYWNEVSFRRCTRPAAAKVVAIDGETATLERCELAKITRRAKAFGQVIDKTPYRWQWQVKRPLSELKLLHPSVARGLEQKREAILRYPTKGERDYQRMKRRKAREKGASA